MQLITFPTEVNQRHRRVFNEMPDPILVHIALHQRTIYNPPMPNIELSYLVRQTFIIDEFDLVLFTLMYGDIIYHIEMNPDIIII